MAEALCAPVNRINEFTLCESELGQTPVVAGTVSRMVVALDSVIVVTPPSMASTVCQFGFNADVPQDPGKSDVLGTIKYFAGVTGSVIALHPNLWLFGEGKCSQNN